MANIPRCTVPVQTTQDSIFSMRYQQYNTAPRCSKGKIMRPNPGIQHKKSRATLSKCHPAFASAVLC